MTHRCTLPSSLGFAKSRLEYYAILLEIVEFSLVYEISLITLILIKSYDFSRRSSYDSLFLSFVLHFFVQFSRCDSWVKLRVQHLILTKCWNLTLTLLSGFLRRRGASRSVYKGTRKAKQQSIIKNLVGLSGLEPPTSRLSGGRSNRLSYKPMLVEIIGIEPMTPCLQSRCSPSWAIPPGLSRSLTDLKN